MLSPPPNLHKKPQSPRKAISPRPHTHTSTKHRMTHKCTTQRLVVSNGKLSDRHHAAFLASVHSEGIEKAAKAFKLSRATAYRWKQQQPKKRGRKPLTANCLLIQKRLSEIADRRELDGDEEHVPFPSYMAIAKQYAIEYKKDIGRRAVASLLALEGYRPIVRPKHPALDNRDARKAFTKKWARKSPKNVVFSDEHFVSTNASTTHKMLVKRGARPVPKSCKRRQNVPNFQIWAAIGHDYKSPLVIFPIRKTTAGDDDDSGDKRKNNFRLDAKGYTRRCLPKVKAHLQRPGIIFMQDGARCHWANSVKAYFAKNGITAMTDFPASSPDLNPIESVWAQLNRLIYAKRPKSVPALRAAAISAWDAIPQHQINNYIARFQTDARRVYANGGV